ncbi:MAG TPA: 2'-5' RNA ligase family protein [Jiangellaceae bacterium]
MTVPEPLRDHWWWRAGWQVGRSFYTWHITFADEPAVAQLAADYGPALDHLPMYDPVPQPWLHLTMQGIGFTDEVSRADIGAITAAAQRRLSQLEPFTVTIGPAFIDPEALSMPVRPVEPLARLRAEIRAAIADVWGADAVPEQADGYRPHVSLGYSNRATPAQPAIDTLAAHPPHSVDVPVTKASVIDLNRDKKAYVWTEIATVQLSPS